MAEDVKAGKTDTKEELLYDQLAVMRKQLRLTRFITAAAALVTAIFLIVMLMIVPPAVQSLKRADRLLKGLEEADLAGAVENVNNLAKSSQEEIDRTVDKLNKLDVDSLNKAIQNLESATRPLAGLFGDR